ncbi:MAG TPA: hypothetical protein VNR36_12895 [Pseudolysinimonas sp.]|nr:hypothetical protein [Pseudolysinimonas sp.]
MTRSRRILALVGAVLVLALAGCVRFQADLSVDEQNNLDGDIVVAVITNDDDPDSPRNAADAVAQIEDQLLPELRGSDGVTAKPYEEDDYVGTRFTLDDTPISALDGGDADGALTLTRTGDEFEFTGTLDFTPDDEQVPQDVEGDPGDGGIVVSISFPGEVTDHNGELDGTTVTWSTSLEGSVTMHATASAIPAAPSAGAVIAIVVGVLVGLLLVALLVLLLVRRRSRSITP